MEVGSSGSAHRALACCSKSIAPGLKSTSSGPKIGLFCILEALGLLRIATGWGQTISRALHARGCLEGLRASL